MKYLVFVLFAIGMVACEEESFTAEYESSIIGEWSHITYVDSLTILTKVRSLSDNEYGIRFNSDGTLEEIKNSGFCGTPPVSYAEFTGTWESLNDSVISITSLFWGGRGVEGVENNGD